MNENAKARVRACIELVRDRNGGSLRAAARAIGVTHACLSLALSGDRRPGPRLVKGLTKALGRHPDDMFTPAGQMLEPAESAPAVATMPAKQEPIPMRLPCERCGELHIDVGEFATRIHHTHSCQHCGLTWRPAVVPTVGVRFLPGFKNEPEVDHA